MDFFLRLFDPTGFPARWDCGPAWADEPYLGWLHIGADLITWFAYLMIPIVLAYFTLKRDDIVFPRVFWLFCGFILACGTVHLVEGLIFWWPVYRLSAVVKVLTAIVSTATVFALIRVTPSALKLPSLAVINARLEKQIEAEVAIEKELRATRDRLEFAIGGTSDGLWEWNVQTGEVWCTPRYAMLLGYSPDDFPQRVEMFTEFQHPDDVDSVWDAMQRHLHQKTPLDIEFRMRLRDGRYRWFRSRGAAVWDEDGTPLRLAGSIQDISARKRDEKRIQSSMKDLEAANAELEQFAYVAAHDLRAPLRGITQLAHWIEEEDGERLSDESKENLGDMFSRIERMQTLLDDLLVYSRVGQRQAPIERTNVGEVLRNVAAILEFPEEFELVIEEPMPEFETTRIPLQHVLLNLIDNALKHHDKSNGTIGVRCEEEDLFYVFHVSDDGPGIAPEYHERIFKMFQTLQSRDTVEGSGMGLAVIRKTVRQIGGDVQVHSAPGEGTTFSIYWPKQISDSKHDDPTDAIEEEEEEE